MFGLTKSSIFVLLGATAIFPHAAQAVDGEIVLYENDFESPKRSVELQGAKCPYGATNMDDVNVLYSGQGKSDHSQTDFGSGVFGQHNTVETLVVNSDALYDSTTHYTQDPPGKAGKYAVAMIRTDWAWLDFAARADLPYFSLELDISQINLPSSCDANDPRTLQAPVFILTLLTNDSGTWTNIGSPQRITGSPPSQLSETKWTHHQVQFNKAAHTSLRIEIHTEGYYNVFDNLRITQTVTAAPTHAPTTASPTSAPTSASAPPRSPGGGANGDPHFRLWNGAKYDFHGACDLALLLSPSFADGLGIAIHIRTKIQTWWSFIEVAVLRIGDSVLEITGGPAGGTAYLNGKLLMDHDFKDDDFKISGFSVIRRKPTKIQTRYRIEFGNGAGAMIETYKNFVGVNVMDTSVTEFVNSTGLMGSFPDGEKVGRDGITVYDDPIEFAKEWQIRESEPMLFRSSEGSVQHPKACVMPNAKLTDQARKRGRRLGSSLVSRADAELACDHLPVDDKDSCIFDVLATNDVGMAGAW